MDALHTNIFCVYKLKRIKQTIFHMGDSHTPPHTLFIKQLCRFCKALTSAIGEAGLTAEFAIVDVSSQPISPSIQHVPAVLADHQHLFVGREAFAWVNDYINQSPKCVMTPSGMKCAQWDSISSPFTLIDGQEDADTQTNTSMSAVYSSFIDAAPSISTETNASDSLGDAMSKLQKERDAVVS